MGVGSDILRTWTAPGAVLERQLCRAPDEPRALAVLMAACGLMFLAQWPLVLRAAATDPTIPLEARLGGALMAWLFLVPPIAYLVAVLSQGMLRALGRRTTAFGARMALFWAMLAAAPLWLANGLVGGLSGPGPLFSTTQILALAATLGLWLRGLWRIGRAG